MRGKVCSHPGRDLHEHLQGTLAVACQIAGFHGIELTDEEKTAVLVHDLGKAHPLFQAKLCGNCDNRGTCLEGMERLREKKRPQQYGHAEPSAAMVLALTRNVVAAEAVRRHHTHLEGVSDIKDAWFSLEWSNEHLDGVIDRVRGLEMWDGGRDILRQIGFEGGDSWAAVMPSRQVEWNDFLFDHVEDGLAAMSGEDCLRKWFRLRLLYSILVAADRYDAAVKAGISFKTPEIQWDRVKAYIDSLPDSPVRAFQESVRRQAVQRAREIITRPGIYTLTLPTGSGKTLIGLEIAMGVCERLKAKNIIYVLPFVTLVEQNAQVAAKLLAEVREDHHLAYGKDGDEELTDTERFIQFFRYWPEPVVVTTMAKLWEVLYGIKANETMSLHRLAGSVVIIDEPQGIPRAYWATFYETVKLLSEKMGTVFVLMTATQPEIVQGKELAPPNVRFPRVRHCFHWIPGKRTVEEAAAYIEERGLIQRDCLLVLNTRRSALLMWLEMKKRGLSPYFLSAWLTPHHRQQVMTRLRYDEGARIRRCLVSTQIVEAGVDLDFECAFRDLGPLDSIVQVAGRCNRRLRSEVPGDVYIMELWDGSKTYAASVYKGSEQGGSVLLNQTRLLLNENEHFDEATCPGIVSEYYRRLKDAVPGTEWWDLLKKGLWGEYRSLFGSGTGHEVMLLIDEDGGLARRLDELVAPLSMTDKMEEIRRRRAVFQELAQHSINVPLRYLEHPEEGWSVRLGCMVMGKKRPSLWKHPTGIWVLDANEIGRVYRKDVGFVPPYLSELVEEITNG
ncbi:MAG TPA: CRISPR-associated endonuclease Cas3'' [Syntrophothermus lipocalidus]|nr:CRISPR-associated endonuclease Cas3'' [Syntrophothermus lipocalidus]